MTDNIDIPVIDDPDIELDDGLQENPQLREAIRNAQLGQYEHTLFEMWEDILDEAIRQVSNGVSIPLADGLLRQWPWLRYKDLPQYLTERRKLLEEAKTLLQQCYPKPAELLFQENNGDWEEHKDAYIDVIVAWTRASNAWAEQWDLIPLSRPDKGIMHAVIADMTTLLIHPSKGLAEQMQNLAGFDITESDSEALSNRIAGVDDE